MITGAKIALFISIVTPALAGGGYVAKLAGDTVWLSLAEYKADLLWEVQEGIADLEEIRRRQRALTIPEESKLERLRRREKHLLQNLD